VTENYSWVQWAEGPRRGPAANRNHGSTLAKGKWLSFTDDDCLPKSDWLKAFADAIKPSTIVYEGKTTCELGIRTPMEQSPINLSGGCLWSCNMLIQKDFFVCLGGFDESFPQPHMEDVDLRERILLANQFFLFVAKAIVDHPPRRVHKGRKLGAYHESEIMFWCRNKKPHPFLTLFVILIKSRVVNIFSFRPSWDTVNAFVSLGIELIYIFEKMPEWKRKYQKLK